MKSDTDFRQFFQRYAELSLSDEPERIAALYAESFLAGGPKGTATFQNNEEFFAWLRRVRDFNLASGMTGLDVVDVTEVPMGDAFVFVTVLWQAHFRQLEEPARFEISYIIRLGEEGARILVYLAHEDQEEAMEELGLL